jgi:hypothetical protein
MGEYALKIAFRIVDTLNEDSDLSIDAWGCVQSNFSGIFFSIQFIAGLKVKFEFRLS